MKKNDTVNLIVVRNQIREILGCYKKDEKNFYFAYQALVVRCDESFYWSMFGKKKIPQLAKTKAAFVKQLKKYQLPDYVKLLFERVYVEELEKSKEYTESRVKHIVLHEIHLDNAGNTKVN